MKTVLKIFGLILIVIISGLIGAMIYRYYNTINTPSEFRYDLSRSLASKRPTADFATLKPLLSIPKKIDQNIKLTNAIHYDLSFSVPWENAEIDPPPQEGFYDAVDTVKSKGKLVRIYSQLDRPLENSDSLKIGAARLMCKYNYIDPRRLFEDYLVDDYSMDINNGYDISFNALKTTPNDLTPNLPKEKLFANELLLFIKGGIMFGLTDEAFSTDVYNFDTSYILGPYQTNYEYVTGFQFGDPTKTGVVSLLLFNSKGDKQYSLTTYGLTQEDLNTIILSARIKN